MASRRRVGVGVLGLALALLGASCGVGASDQGGETISLTVGAGHEVGGITYATYMDEFLIPELEKRVEERTDHSLNINKAFAGAVADTDEALDAVDNGTLDIGGMCYCFFPSELFLHNVAYFVPFSSPDPELANKAYRKVFDEVPYMTEVLEEEYNQKLLGVYPSSSYELITQFPVDSLQSMDGHKIAAAGPNIPWIPESAVNVTGVQGALPEWYTGIQTGVYEGAIMFPEGTVGFKLHEVAQHQTNVGFGAVPQGGVHINLDTWEQLPSDVQDIVVEVGQEYEETIPQAVIEEREAALSTMEDEGTTISELDAQTRQEWANALTEYPRQQMNEAESRGLEDARKVFETYIEEQEALGYEFPRDWKL